MAAGELETAWFERHGSTSHHRAACRLAGRIPRARRAADRLIIEQIANIALIEQPEYKRRWNIEPWEAAAERALRDWLLAAWRAENSGRRSELTSVSKLG